MSNQMIKEVVRAVKRSDYHKDEEHPYGNKLDKRFVTMRGLKGFRTGGAIGATLSPALGAAGHQFVGLPGAIIGAAIPAAAGGMYGAKINKEIAQEERALSHLPIKEQKALKNDIKKALMEMNSHTTVIYRML